MSDDKINVIELTDTEFNEVQKAIAEHIRAMQVMFLSVISEERLQALKDIAEKFEVPI